MIAEHAAAVLSAIDVPNVTVYDGLVPREPSYPYVALYTALSLSAGDLSHQQTHASAEFRTHCVALRGDQVRALQQRVRAQLVDRRLTVAGRALGQVVLEDSSPIEAELMADPPVVLAVDVWSIASFPAST